MSSGEDAAPPGDTAHDGPQPAPRGGREYGVAAGQDIDAALRRAYTCAARPRADDGEPRSAGRQEGARNRALRRCVGAVRCPSAP